MGLKVSQLLGFARLHDNLREYPRHSFESKQIVWQSGHETFNSEPSVAIRDDVLRKSARLALTHKGQASHGLAVLVHDASEGFAARLHPDHDRTVLIALEDQRPAEVFFLVVADHISAPPKA